MDRAQLLETVDPGFPERFEKSQPYVSVAGRWLQSKGYTVEIPDQELRPSVAQRWQFVDDGDLLVTMRVEVKHRTELTFRSPKEFPFKSVIVDEVYKWDKLTVKPLGYIILNKDATACFFIKGDTSEHWGTMTKPDRVRNLDCTYYVCPVELCQFYRIPARCRDPLLQRGRGAQP